MIARPTTPGDKWGELSKVFPPKSRRLNGRDWRRTLDGILFIKTTGIRWSNAPKRYHTPAALRKGAEHAAKVGLWASLVEKIDADELALPPERLRTLRKLAVEWSRKAEGYAGKRQ
jgi:hypothetical protein